MTDTQGATLVSSEEDLETADDIDNLKKLVDGKEASIKKITDAELKAEREKSQKHMTTELNILQSKEDREIEGLKSEEKRKKAEHEETTNPKRLTLTAAISRSRAVEARLRQLKEYIARKEDEIREDEAAYERSIAEIPSEEKVHASYHSERQSIKKSTSDAFDLFEQRKKADEKRKVKEYRDKLVQFLQSELSNDHSTTDHMVPIIRPSENGLLPSSNVRPTAGEVSTSTGPCSPSSVRHHSELSRMLPEISTTVRSSSADAVPGDPVDNSLPTCETVTQPSAHLSEETSQEVPRELAASAPSSERLGAEIQSPPVQDLLFTDKLLIARSRSEEEVRIANSISVASSRNPSPSEPIFQYRQIAPTACMVANPESGRAVEENNGLLSPTATTSDISPTDTVANLGENLSPPSEVSLMQQSSMIVDELQDYVDSQRQPQVESPIANSPPREDLRLVISPTGIYLAPIYLTGVPVEKIEETDPYFTAKRTWRTFREIMEANPQAPAEARKSTTHCGSTKSMKNSSTTIEKLEKWLEELSFHPNQLLAKDYLPKQGLINLNFLPLLQGIFEQLRNASNDGRIGSDPLTWLRQHLMRGIVEAKLKGETFMIKVYLRKFHENNHIYEQVCEKEKRGKRGQHNKEPANNSEQENISNDEGCISDAYSPNKKSNTAKSHPKLTRKRKRNAGKMTAKSSYKSPYGSKKSRVDDCSDTEDAIYVVPTTPPRPSRPLEEDSLMVTLRYNNHNAIPE